MDKYTSLSLNVMLEFIWLFIKFLQTSAMKLIDISAIIDGKFLTRNYKPDQTITYGFAADLMSDVLAYVPSGSVLITGLCSSQVIRTALMADISAVILVLGKSPKKDMLALSESENVPIIGTQHGIYTVCGRLFQAGLLSINNRTK